MIMDKVKSPRGLIRYASYNSIAGNKKKSLNLRIIGYISVFVLIFGIFSALLAGRKPIETTILRTAGSLYQEVIDGYISNLYSIKVVNKSYEERKITLELVEPKSGQIRMIKAINLEEDDLAESAFFIDIPKDSIESTKIPVTIHILSDGEKLEKFETAFVAPIRTD
jgi:polyferredoxin